MQTLVEFYNFQVPQPCEISFNHVSNQSHGRIQSCVPNFFKKDYHYFEIIIFTHFHNIKD